MRARDSAAVEIRIISVRCARCGAIIVDGLLGADLQNPSLHLVCRHEMQSPVGPRFGRPPVADVWRVS